MSHECRRLMPGHSICGECGRPMPEPERSSSGRYDADSWRDPETLDRDYDDDTDDLFLLQQRRRNGRP